MPMILSISMNYESFDGTHMASYKEDGDLMGFIGAYW